MYIKNYPLAESRHRKELNQNQDYVAFVQSVSTDPRIRKRDLTTFLSRPVTRLPRLNLLLEQILKLTDDGHPDKETLPIILDILTSCIKVIFCFFSVTVHGSNAVSQSTQPGIEAAENKVKFWELGQSLIFQKGELIASASNVAHFLPNSFQGYGPVCRYSELGSIGSSLPMEPY